MRISTCVGCFLGFITYDAAKPWGYLKNPMLLGGYPTRCTWAMKTKIPGYLVFFWRIILLPSYTCREYFINPLIFGFPSLTNHSISWAEAQLLMGQWARGTLGSLVPKFLASWDLSLFETVLKLDFWYIHVHIPHNIYINGYIYHIYIYRYVMLYSIDGGEVSSFKVLVLFSLRLKDHSFQQSLLIEDKEWAETWWCSPCICRICPRGRTGPQIVTSSPMISCKHMEWVKV